MGTIWVVGLALAFMVNLIGIGVTERVLYNNTSLCSGDRWVISALFWYGALPVIAGRELAEIIPAKIRDYKTKKQLKINKRNLPPIYIKPGAEIQALEEYKTLKQLCVDFETKFEANQEIEMLLGQ